MSLLDSAKKMLKQHPKQVDEAIQKAAKLAKEHVPSQGDSAIDAAAKAAEKEL